MGLDSLYIGGIQNTARSASQSNGTKVRVNGRNNFQGGGCVTAAANPPTHVTDIRTRDSKATPILASNNKCTMVHAGAGGRALSHPSHRQRPIVRAFDRPGHPPCLSRWAVAYLGTTLRSVPFRQRPLLNCSRSAGQHFRPSTPQTAMPKVGDMAKRRGKPDQRLQLRVAVQSFAIARCRTHAKAPAWDLAQMTGSYDGARSVRQARGTILRPRLTLALTRPRASIPAPEAPTALPCVNQVTQHERRC